MLPKNLTQKRVWRFVNFAITKTLRDNEKIAFNIF